jgi:hypothetical protein
MKHQKTSHQRLYTLVIVISGMSLFEDRNECSKGSCLLLRLADVLVEG